MSKKKSPKKKPPKKKVKKQPKPKRPTDVQPDVQLAPGIMNEGIPAGPQPASMPSGLPEKVGHWGHDLEKE